MTKRRGFLGSVGAGRLKVCIFSKRLQFVKDEALARTAAEIGPDGIDITACKGGHATMADPGIHNYRRGGFQYAPDPPIAARLKAFRPRIAKLTKLNSRDNACAMHHTHSGVGGWTDRFNITGSYLRGIAVKNYVGGRNTRGAWRAQWVPLGGPTQTAAPMRRDPKKLRGDLAQAAL
jgi:hypothetical protein